MHLREATPPLGGRLCCSPSNFQAASEVNSHELPPCCMHTSPLTSKDSAQDTWHELCPRLADLNHVVLWTK